MTILPQEVWFARFPFEDDPTRSKDRPVIVLHVEENSCKVLSMKVTSRPPFSEFEIEIFNWAQIPLPHSSTADASSVQYVSKSDFRRRIGKLSDDDWENVLQLYESFLATH